MIRIPFLGGVAHGETRDLMDGSKPLPRIRVPVPINLTMADVIAQAIFGEIDYKEPPRFDCHDYDLRRRGEFLWYQWDQLGKE